MVLDKKALNLEMLERAGFTCTGGIWTYPDGVDVDNGVPFFPGSLDECFKWFKGKFISIACGSLCEDNWKGAWAKVITHERKTAHVMKEGIEPALAFCLAVRELK